MPEVFEFDIQPDEINFDSTGRVIVNNNGLREALSAMSAGSIAEATCNNSCGDTGCGNTVNSGCGSSSRLYYDDWAILEQNEVLIRNIDLTKGLLHAKIAGDLVIPTKIEVQ